MSSKMRFKITLRREDGLKVSLNMVSSENPVDLIQEIAKLVTKPKKKNAKN